MLCLSVTAEESANNFKNKLSNLFPGVNEKKLLGHRMGTRMMGLAPRPPFLRPTVAWSPLLGALGFP